MFQFIAAAARFAVGRSAGRAAASRVASKAVGGGGRRGRTHRSAGAGRTGGGGGGSGGGGGHAPASPAPSSLPLSAADKERGLEKLWRADTAWNLFDRTLEQADQFLPSFIHAIKVSVVGGPATDLRRVWYLACAAAFGRYRNRVNGLSDCNIEGVWDVTGKAASVSISYSLSGIPGNFPTSTSDLKVFGGALMFSLGTLIGNSSSTRAGLVMAADGAANPTAIGIRAGTPGGIDLMQDGPDQITIGDSWPSTLRSAPPSGLTNAQKIGTGGYTAYFNVVISCIEDDALARFTQSKLVNVLGELPYNPDRNTRIIPFGQVISTASYDTVVSTYPTSNFKPYGMRRQTPRFRTAPLLPDDGRLITTGEKRDPRVQPPRPWVDGHSRMSTVDLITQVLYQPCYAPPGVGCPVVTAGGSNPVSFYQPGGGITWTLDDAKKKVGLAFVDPNSPRTDTIPRLER